MAYNKTQGHKSDCSTNIREKTKSTLHMEWSAKKIMQEAVRELLKKTHILMD